VGEESCVGERGTRNLADEAGETVDEMLEATRTSFAILAEFLPGRGQNIRWKR